MSRRPKQLATVDYASGRSGFRRLAAHWKIWLLTAVLAISALNAPLAWHRLKVAHLSHKCLGAALPPGQTVMLRDPPDVPAHLPKVVVNGYPSARIYGHRPQPWIALKAELGIAAPDFPFTIYLQERTAADGSKWIVAVEFDGEYDLLFTLVEQPPPWRRPRIYQGTAATHDFRHMMAFLFVSQARSTGADLQDLTRVGITFEGGGQVYRLECRIQPDSGTLQIINPEPWKPKVPTTSIVKFQAIDQQ